MTDALEAWLQQQLGVAVLRHGPVGGGCIHSAWWLELANGRRLFLKTNRADALPLLAAEADGLAALVAVAPAALRVPAPLAWGQVEDQAALLLSWLELGRSGDGGGWSQLGQNLARLHRRSLDRGPGQGRFGWTRDNFIGASPQCNRWHQNWGPFFTAQRLAHQLQLAEARGLVFRGAGRLLEQVPRWLEAHAPEPVLVHGDLWSGNAALLASGGGAIFDPAVYRGDREVDLAMAQLFGGFPPAFFAGYEREWPLPPGADARIDLYNLYHLLNHANLFGGGYIHQAQACVEGLLAR